MEIRSTPIAAIKPYENNPRNNERAVEYVANSIREFGFKQPIVIDSGGVIVAGHTRYLAAQSLGLEAVPCVVADDLTPEQVRAYRLADNKTAELAGWDASKLERELNEIIAGMDMAMFGFAADELDALVSTVADIQGDCDNAPPVMDTVITQPGDIYVLDGKHRVMCGDATNAAHMAMLMDGEKARLIVTDPPYNVDYEGKAGKIANDKMLDADFEKMVVAAFANMRDIAEPGAFVLCLSRR